jgi:uncharacterized protein YbdZ (MbtH family)
VINDEEQYSIWPADKGDAVRLAKAGHPRIERQCLAVIQRGLDGHAAAQSSRTDAR